MNDGTDKKRIKSLLLQNAEAKKTAPHHVELTSHPLAVAKPISDNFRHLWPTALIVLGSIGCVLTSPLLLLGGVTGMLVGAMTKNDLFDSGLFGAHIGSLGSLLAIYWGMGAIKPRQTETAEQLSKPFSEAYRTTASVNFNNAAEVKAFITKVREQILLDEAKAEPKKTDNSSRVNEPYILKLISITKDDKAPPHEFWGRLEQMIDKDIHTFVSKLSLTKEGKFSSSELDCLWRRFKGTEFEPSVKEQKKNKFVVMLEALSDTQLSASFSSSDFLSLLTQNEYIEAVVNTLTSEQLELFATNIQKHELLNSMLKKLKADVFALGKLLVIMPFATQELKAELLKQIAALSYPVSFKTELGRLADYYIKINNQVRLLAAKNTNTVPQDAVEKEKPISKWAPVIAKTLPIYAVVRSAKKEKWEEGVFEAFLRQLNSPSYLLNEKTISADLDNLPDDNIKMLVDRAASSEFKNVLKHLWVIESKPNNHGSYIIGRTHRLKIILEQLTEAQLKEAITENKFWDIFRNTQQPHCEMAAKVLTPRQFKIIISNATLERHADFATLITLIKKDDSKDKARLIKIIKEIVPFTSPWFVLALELKIKDLLGIDKEECSLALKMHLSASMKREDVNLKYSLDTTLNKAAISKLFVANEAIMEPDNTPACSI
ncbi:hypothetical protein [uncultured Legionella sp.]|uniref:hypothetical protein n=1 Tax=uncultured Legionella sp. TaxID=210934 RepID=UPI002638ED6B|nr:hypothetical protein [uncultured Legionella sp.]